MLALKFCKYSAVTKTRASNGGIKGEHLGKLFKDAKRNSRILNIMKTKWLLSEKQFIRRLVRLQRRANEPNLSDKRRSEILQEILVSLAL